MSPTTTDLALAWVVTDEYEGPALLEWASRRVPFDQVTPGHWYKEGDVWKYKPLPGDSPFPTLEYQEPPPPTGKPGRKAGGFSASLRDQTCTDLGEFGEDLTRELGTTTHHRPKGGERDVKQQHPIDVLKDDWAIEVKTRLTTATEYRVGMKTGGGKDKIDEIGPKLAWARENGKKPGLMIVVYDEKTRIGYCYFRPGIENGRLSEENGWQFVGTVDAASPAEAVAKAIALGAYDPVPFDQVTPGHWYKQNGQWKLKPSEGGEEEKPKLTAGERKSGLQVLGAYGGSDWNYSLRSNNCGDGSSHGNCRERTPILDKFIAAQDDQPEGKTFWRGLSKGLELEPLTQFEAKEGVKVASRNRSIDLRGTIVNVEDDPGDGQVGRIARRTLGRADPAQEPAAGQRRVVRPDRARGRRRDHRCGLPLGD